MISIPDLIGTLETLLGDRLGTYTFVSLAATTPAIWNGMQAFPEQPDVEGLECVVSRQPVSPIRPILGGYQRTNTVAIALKQWDITKDTIAALDAIVVGLTEFTVTDIRQVLRDETLDNIETCTILIEEVELFTVR